MPRQLKLLLRHPGRLLLWGQGPWRQLLVLVARGLIRGSEACGLPLDSFRLFGVASREVTLPTIPCPVPAPAAGEPAGGDPLRSLQAWQQRPVIRRKFLEKPAPLPAGSLWIPHGCANARGVVVDGQGALVNPWELDQEEELRDFRQARLLPPRRRLEGTVLTLAHRYHYNYFHWLFDVLSRLALAQILDLPYTHLHIQQRRPFQQQSLGALGITAEQIVCADRGDQIQATTLLSLTVPRAFSVIPGWACSALRTRLLPAALTPGRQRLYLSRADAPTRRLRNEAAVSGWLSGLGFRILQASDLDFRSQIAAFADAEMIIAAHGAALANLVFCAPGTTVIECMPPRYVFGCWHDLASRCGLDYHLLGGADLDLEIDHGWRHQHDDFELDLGALQALVGQLLRT